MTRFRNIGLALIVAALILLWATLANAQITLPPTPRPVSTLPATPCSPRDFVQAADTGSNSICAKDGLSWATIGSGAGTVTSVSVVTANGQSGTVANSTTTPAITLNNPTALVVSTSLNVPIIKPPSDSTTALQITKTDGATRVVDVDTTNARVGINKTPGAFDLDVNGAVNLASTLAVATSIVDPLVVGGNAVGSNLSLQSTSAAGTTDFVNVLVGNNGATEAARFFHSGGFSVGTTTDPGAGQVNALNGFKINGTQIACSALSNSAASCSTDATNATNITSGTLANARLSAQVVLTNQANTYSGTGLQDMNTVDLRQPVHSADPAACSTGQIEYNSTGSVMKFCSATNVWTQLGAAGAAGGGITVYSGPSLTLTGTLYFPPGGGGASSGTETNVDVEAPTAATITNLYVQMAATPTSGNVVYTWRKNAAATSLTCTITNPATTCNDTTHSFTVAQGDLVDIQAVASATSAAASLVVSTQFGTTGSNGTVNSGTINQIAWYAATGTAVSGLATANNGVLLTSGSGVPSIGTVTANLSIASSQLDTVQGIQTSSSPQFAAFGLGVAAPSAGIKIIEAAAPSGAASSDFLYADSTAHRLKMNNNNGGAVQVVASGADINTSDQVTVTHLAAALPIAQGGTNCTSASITCFNNITGFTAAGTTGTTSTNLVFSTSPSLTTQVVVGGLTASGSGANDFSGSTGTFKTSTGAVTIGSGATTLTGVTTLTPPARSSGAAAYLTLNIPADTLQTAATESPGFTTVTATRQWATTGTVALQRENFFAGPTYSSQNASQTFTDAFTLYATPPVAGTNAIFTRGHTLGIVDSTSAASSVTGGLVVSTTLGTTATSVGIGGGNVNAGGTGTFATSVTTQHLIGGGSAPTIAAGAGAGTSPTISVAGTDNDGEISLTTGTVPTSNSIVATVTFNAAFGAAPKCVLWPSNGAAGDLPGLNGVGLNTTTTTTTFVLNVSANNNIPQSVAYKWMFHCAQ